MFKLFLPPKLQRVVVVFIPFRLSDALPKFLWGTRVVLVACQELGARFLLPDLQDDNRRGIEGIAASLPNWHWSPGQYKRPC
ncbi:hypothetical protein B0T24DRAFT_637200 [Lasiosphaeria ovina]|uniref:Uncharacterized protein n=1 Tax=Lasiosphaeria ovina TaxID=92902 RepID=A0AAE0N073_9PEZI|nr:hypothetical protein B0T24DRAFT_637200 [Lasiosphaeria ovina]